MNPKLETGTRLLGRIALFAATVFLSVFLLFQVQPMIGKYILPWFGSTPGVWATSLLFFQLMLLGGYAYAHFVVGRLTWRRQALVHSVLLGLVLITLPITPAEALKPTGSEAPVSRILFILTLSVGAPFFLLSTTAPLLQSWFARLVPGRSPYRLYALSNLGSLLALLSYPFVVEPSLRLRTQTSIWSWGYVLFAAMCATCAWLLSRTSSGALSPVDVARTSGSAQAEQAAEAVEVGRDEIVEASVPWRETADRPGAGKALLWLALAACGSGLLLATTNQMSIDVAVVPFLWIVPLSLYLLTFILCFDSDRWYARPLFAALLPLSLINSVRLLYWGTDLGIVDQIAGYSITLFVCCMACHGEVARMRPPARHLTFFFLMVAIGGAVGGIFVAILAPVVFAGFYEYQILLVACYALVVLVQTPQLFRGERNAIRSVMVRALSALCWGAAVVAITIGTWKTIVPGTWYGDDGSQNLAAAFTSLAGRSLRHRAVCLWHLPAGLRGLASYGGEVPSGVVGFGSRCSPFRRGCATRSGFMVLERGSSVANSGVGASCGGQGPQLLWNARDQGA